MTAPARRLQTALFPTRTRPVLRLRREAEATIRALRADGLLRPRDQLLVGLVRTAADAADEHRADPGAAFHLSATLKLLTELDGRLRELAGPTDDALDDLIAAAGSSAPPRDAA
jgi:hypothetical protein